MALQHWPSLYRQCPVQRFPDPEALRRALSCTSKRHSEELSRPNAPMACFVWSVLVL